MLRGKVLHKQPPFMLLDVHGVGYEIEAPMSTFYNLPMGDDTVTLYTHLAIRDDAHVLYGFIQESDRVMFRALIKVSGVGGKMALAILSGMSTDEFTLSIQAGDVASLTRTPGVGKKTAERLIIEMRDRLEKLNISATPSAAVAGTAVESPDNDAASALIALGYKPVDAARMVKKVSAEGMGTEAIIKAALQGTAR